MIWMTPRRFNWTLRARGPALAEWPPRERSAAVTLLRRCPAARELLAESLAAEDAPPSDPAALARVTCPVSRALAPLTPLMRTVRWGALAACVASGLALGTIWTDSEIAAGDLLPVLHPTMPATVLAALDQ